MIEKIKKLLRLANDKAATPAEAANAMTRAIELAKSAGLKIDEIDINSDSETGGLHHDSAGIAALGDAEKHAIQLVTRQFPVTPFVNIDDNGKRIVQFIGTRDGCQLARYSFTYLVRVMRKAWAENTDRRIKRPGFLAGFALAIQSQMPRVFKELPGTGLVLSTNDYITKHLIPAGTKTTTVASARSPKNARASFAKGYVAGKKQGISNALRGGTINLT